MPEPPRDAERLQGETSLARQVARRAARKQRAREAGKQPIWFSLGLMGLVGWSIAVPTLAGVALGWWIDSTWPGRISWTLTLLFVGVAAGCVNAWYWVRQESSGE
jgi:ATP synthase protein I